MESKQERAARLKASHERHVIEHPEIYPGGTTDSYSRRRRPQRGSGPSWAARLENATSGLVQRVSVLHALCERLEYRIKQLQEQVRFEGESVGPWGVAGLSSGRVSEEEYFEATPLGLEDGD